jgi:RNA polymerase sigma-70 factor (sigma-E family)
VMDRRGGRAPVRQEFDRFVAEAGDGLLRAAYLITWDLADAEDLVQDCLFKVARRWPRVRRMEHPAAYARTVLVHLALDDGKHRSRRRAELAEAATASFDQHEDETAVRVLGRVETSADLMQALGELSPRQRVALVLRYFEDLCEADVAEAMGCSVGTVKSTTSRALDRLRGLVEVPADSSNRNAEGPTTTNAIHLNDRKDTCVVTQGLRTNEGSITP